MLGRGEFRMTSALRRVRVAFVHDGSLRSLWRAILFLAIGRWLLLPLVFSVSPRIHAALGLQRGLGAGSIAIDELLLFTVALVCTSPFAFLEQSAPTSYGLPIGRALGRDTGIGAMCGFGMAFLVAAGMFTLGGIQIHGLAASGAAVAWNAMAWLIANVCVGVAEEFWYRSYALQTLWKSLGFWPAAALLSLLFTADHYFYKADENVWDMTTLMSLSLLLCYSVKVTGTLWFAVGFHSAFDYMQFFVIGTPNGAATPVGRLLDVSFSGPGWLTGGPLGTEASILMYPAIAALWWFVARYHRKDGPETPP